MGNSSLVSLADAFPNIMETLKKQPPEMLTGIDGLDEELITISGKYISIPAESSCGKTALCTTIAANRIVKGGAVLFVSLEVGEETMVRRFASHFANRFSPSVDVPVQPKYGIDALSDKTIDALKGGIELLDQCKHNLYLVDGSEEYGGKDIHYVERIEKKAKEISMKHGMPCLVICDYFQLLLTREATGTATEKFDTLSHKLARMAHETGCAVIVPCSTNKDGSIRGSGQVSFDNDITLQLVIDQEECSESDLYSLAVRPMIAHVKKNRDGRAQARVKLDYRPASHRFINRGGEF